MTAEDERLGHLLKLLRQRSGRTQVQLALAAAVPLRDLKRVEDGLAAVIKLGRLRDLLAACDGRGRFVPWWNGASADRLLDERHARLVERVVAVLAARGWEVDVEMSFAEYGERGSIDVFASRRDRSAVAVCEVKSALGSLEETNRVLDVKERLAPKIAYKRLGWRPSVIGRLLILPRNRTVQRVVAEHASTMLAIYPARGREVRAWLREPTMSVRGIWFVSDGPNATAISPPSV
ncbi:MAG TPA: helix-turn-helix transcriptional regulator [Candidatus Limnocylindrales bacterium]|nr:helix-turn-helix transcriptional regulator [Candidatus Limnocylindrales bacterium]